MILEKYLQRAIQAHSWTSFSPEKRGGQLITEFSEMLEQDFEELKKLSDTEEHLNGLPMLLATYQTKFEDKFSSWISAKGRCISSMITGGSNFPVRRAEKANNSEHNRFTEFMEWREKFKRGVKKSLKKEVNELEVMIAKLQLAKETQEYMKKINKLHAAWLKKPVIETLEGHDLSEHAKSFIINYVPEYSFLKHPFAPYQFQNNGANIKRMEGRVKELESKEVLAKTAGSENILFDAGEIKMNYEEDRIQILFAEKPGEGVRSILKSNGFHWSPFFTAWQRKITPNAKRAMEQIFGVLLP